MHMSHHTQSFCSGHRAHLTLYGADTLHRLQQPSGAHNQGPLVQKQGHRPPQSSKFSARCSATLKHIHRSQARICDSTGFGRNERLGSERPSRTRSCDSRVLINVFMWLRLYRVVNVKFKNALRQRVKPSTENDDHFQLAG